MTSSRAILAALALASALVRASVYLSMPSTAYTSASENTVQYLNALREHLPEYIWITTLKPPLTYMLHGAVVGTLGPQVTIERYGFLALTMILDVAAVCLLWAGARRLGIPNWAALGSAALFSLALVPFELWRLGAHYDHHTPFVSALFAWAACRAFVAPSARTALGVSVTGALVVLQAAVAALIVPATAIAVFTATAVRHGTIRPALRSSGVALAFPLIVTAFIIMKNLAVAGVASTSNLAGPSIMVVVHEVMRSDPTALSALAERHGAPEWYRWCYEHPVIPRDATGEPVQGWDVLARSYGICYPLTEPTDPLWPADMSALRDRLASLGESRLLALVERDIEDARDRRYLLAGFSPELSPRWIGVYGQTSVGLALRAFTDRPREYAGTVARFYAQYAIHGPFFPDRAARGPAENGLRTLTSPIPLEPLLMPASRLYGATTTIAYLAIPALVVLATIGVRRARAWVSRDAALSLWWIAVPILLSTGVYVAIASWEIDRYFMLVTPYMALMTALAASTVVRAVRSVLSR